MIYFKSLVVGSFTLILSVVIYVVIWMWFMHRKVAALVPAGSELGFDLSEVAFDLRGLLTSPLFWLVAILGFALGFILMFRSGTL